MFMLKRLFCISLIVCSLGDEFSINNPDGLLVQITEDDGQIIYRSSSVKDYVEFWPKTRYVRVIAEDMRGLEKFYKRLWTSKVENIGMCNYALLIKDDGGYVHRLSSLSNGCTEDENTYFPDSKATPFVFDNAGGHVVNPSFGQQGGVYVEDTMVLKPGSIRIYLIEEKPDEVSVDIPEEDGLYIARDVISLAVKNPYSNSYVVCNEGSNVYTADNLDERQVIYQKRDEVYKCTPKVQEPSAEESTNTKSLKAANRALKEALNAALN